MRIILRDKRWIDTVGSLLPREVKTFLALTLIAQDGRVQTNFQDLESFTQMCNVTVRRSIRRLEHEGIVRVDSIGRGPGAEMQLTLPKAWVTFDQE